MTGFKTSQTTIKTTTNTKDNNINLPSIAWQGRRVVWKRQKASVVSKSQRSHRRLATGIQEDIKTLKERK